MILAEAANGVNRGRPAAKIFRLPTTRRIGLTPT
jgi:hypothetical protein